MQIETDRELAQSQAPGAEEDGANVWPGRAIVGAWCAIGLGILLRAARYAKPRSLWLDESSVSMEIVTRSFAQLTQKLGHWQAAPIGFLWAQKAATLVLGNNEYGLRLVPLIGGCASLVLFYLIARRVLNWEGALVGVIWFALAASGLYYSSEVKQYSTDALMTCIVLLLGVIALRNTMIRNVIALGAGGVIAIWFSYPVIFVLSGIGLTLGWRAMTQKRRREVFGLVVIGVAWVACFALMYWISPKDDGYFRRFWKDAFLPFPPHGGEDLRAYVLGYFSAFPDSLGVSFHAGQEQTEIAALGGALFALGCYRLIVARNWLAGFLIIPLLATIAASMMQRYPFANRLLMFASPLLVLGIASGFAFVFDLCRTKRQRWGGVVLAAACTLPLVMRLRTVPPRQEVRSAMRIIATKSEPADWIFYNHLCGSQFEFYAPKLGLNRHMLIGNRLFDPYADTLLPVADEISRHRRVWVLLAMVHQTQRLDLHLEPHLIAHGGRRLEKETGDGFSLWLYEFPAAPPTTAPTTVQDIPVEPVKQQASKPVSPG